MKFFYSKLNECLSRFDLEERIISFSIVDLYDKLFYSSPFFADRVVKIIKNNCDIVYGFTSFFNVYFDCKLIGAYSLNGGDWCYLNTDGLVIEEPYQSYLKQKFNYNRDAIIFQFSNYEKVPIDPLISDYILTIEYSKVKDDDGNVYEYMNLLHYKGIDKWDIFPYELKVTCIPDFCVISYDYLKKIRGLL